MKNFLKLITLIGSLSLLAACGGNDLDNKLDELEDHIVVMEEWIEETEAENTVVTTNAKARAIKNTYGVHDDAYDQIRSEYRDLQENIEETREQDDRYDLLKARKKDVKQRMKDLID